jgi:hypothetical protein
MNMQPNTIKRIISLDYYIGLRAWGLILYGALPANLALLGFIKVDITKLENILPFLLPVSALPIFITFLLVRGRHKEWYLTTDKLNIRSALVTALILIFAILISGVSGIIENKYVISFSNITSRSHLIALSESYLMGVGSLVITSTLFMAILAKNTYLPGLPSSVFVDLTTEIRGKLRLLQAIPIWNEYKNQDIDKATDRIKELAESLKKDINNATSHTGNAIAKEVFKPIIFDLDHFEDVACYISKGGTSPALKKHRWKVFFAQIDNLSDKQKAERNRKLETYNSLWKLKGLHLGA